MVYNNIFINGLPIRFSSNSNKADHNLYISTKEPNNFKDVINMNGLDANSIFEHAQAYFTSSISMFKWISDFDIKPVPLLKEVRYDFFNNLKENQNTIPSPFNKLSKDITIVLTENTLK